ncbi:caspase 20, apoptosis-related cysteine peptidase isoform X2 [Rhinichthys klamathensis goyatoka]|uniref:caspase 20, apoptosis-related cysteine peptidase isoform X2 n=1 Tax=Rhinichthys klamathensis goyatoka TaxID=3034132 RepID=UPI0024B5344C|nr:caspase 20, apoptosis-related cysteine peptidase isoform X2 [Rhinichthys klamathensis goyatoka]
MDKKSLQRIVKHKVFLIETLSAEAEFILQNVQQENLITRREYMNLTDIHERQKRVINLLDKLMGKGEETCRKFIDLLRQDSILENCPTLKDHAIFDAPVQVSQYKISQIPRGICVIINNVNFTTMNGRSGSDEDQKYLDKVFRWLGFKVVVHRNKTADEMKNLLTDLGKTVDGDCFVCCVLSHGKKEGVCGTDGGVVSVDEIREPFNGIYCRSLAGKPKLFFIQACRGGQNQHGVKVQADAPEDGESEMDVDGDDFDITIPADTDFLIARSTTDGHYSYRKSEEGSWFIQSLCRNLENHCPLGTDIQTILLCVNNDVSSQGIKCKQMPVHEVAMRKKLILQPVNH